MTKTFTFRARVDVYQQEKLKAMMKATGYSTSQLLRALVDNAEVKSVPVVGAILPDNGNNAVNVFQAHTGIA